MPHKILSDDPEVKSIQGMLNLLIHFGKKNLSRRHLKVMLAVELMSKTTKGKAFARVSDISARTGLSPQEFEVELRELVELRYLHEMHPTFGELIMTYKLGSMGGTLMKKVLPLIAGDRLGPGGDLPPD